ncbi:DUF4328 domain-containing protein, partial [Streptomyces sp. MCAF7]
LFGAYEEYLSNNGGREAISNARESLDIFEVFSGLLEITLVVLFPVWFRRVYLNATFLAPGRQRYGGGLAAGSWFIPVAQLWLPKQIANDIWTSSTPPGTRPASRAVLHWWWALCMAMFLIVVTQSMLEVVAASDEEEQAAVGLGIFNDLISIPASVLAMIVVTRITKMQRPQRWQPDGGAFGPPVMR